MSSSTWKNNERIIAKKANTRRTPLSGSNSAITASDTLHEHFFIEAKQRQKIPFYKTFKETEIKAKKENKIPMVVIHQKYSKRRLVIMDYDTFITNFKYERK